MAVFKVLAVALLAGVVSSADGRPERIVGGNPTTIDQYPSLVQVDFLGLFSETWSQSCAASILNSYYVLSAAHCFDGFFYAPERRRIRAGSTDRNDGGSLTYVDTAFNHPSYGQSGNDGDISVVRMQSQIIYSSVVQPAMIVSQDFNLPQNMPVVHAGWGTVKQGGEASPVLQDVTIYTVDKEVCSSRYSSNVITDNMICAGILDVGGKDACQGDTGGPLFYDNFLVGVASFGQGCAHADYPGVSTRVASYTNWIVATAS